MTRALSFIPFSLPAPGLWMAPSTADLCMRLHALEKARVRNLWKSIWFWFCCTRSALCAHDSHYINLQVVYCMYLCWNVDGVTLFSFYVWNFFLQSLWQLSIKVESIKWKSWVYIDINSSIFMIEAVLLSLLYILCKGWFNVYNHTNMIFLLLKFVFVPAEALDSGVSDFVSARSH